MYLVYSLDAQIKKILQEDFANMLPLQIDKILKTGLLNEEDIIDIAVSNDTVNIQLKFSIDARDTNTEKLYDDASKMINVIKEYLDIVATDVKVKPIIEGEDIIKFN